MKRPNSVINGVPRASSRSHESWYGPKDWAPRVAPGRKGLGQPGYRSDSLEERESGWSRRRSAKARNERRSHSGAGS